MPFRNSSEQFGIVTKALHWLIAALIVCLIALGRYMVGLSYFDRWYNASLAWHKSLGMIALGIALLKIGWQLYTPPPRHEAALRPWERIGARAMHALLLVAMVLIPATGYVVSTSAGQDVSVFGLFDVPALVERNETLRDLAIKSHFYLAYATAVLVIGHAGAALKHQFVNRDGTLKRMLWE